MSRPAVPFEVLDWRQGITYRQADLIPLLTLRPTSYNTSSGLSYGRGPRHGIAIIPGHSHTDATAATPAGLMQSEGAGSSYTSRVKFFGVVPVLLGSYADINTEQVFYVWAVGRAARLDLLVGSTKAGGVYKHEADIAAGLPPSSVEGLSATGEPAYLHLTKNSTPATELASLLTIPSDLNYCSLASLVVGGKNWPMKWFVATDVYAQAAAGSTAIPNYVNNGLPPEYNRGNFKKEKRNLKFYNLFKTSNVTNDYKLGLEYQYPSSPIVAGTFPGSFNQDSSGPNLSLTGFPAPTVVPRLDAAVLTYANFYAVLANDEDALCNSGFTAVFAAAKKPIMMVIQDWQRNSDGTLPQWFDLTQSRNAPQATPTITFSGGGPLVPYTEDGIERNTCFVCWPAYTSAGALPTDAASAYNGTIHVTTGAAGTGLLRSSTDYEFTYSVFDKQFGTESNVGAPVKFRTGAEDFVRLSLFRDLKVAGVFIQATGRKYGAEFRFIGAPNINVTARLNYLEVRFYYRPRGSYEWLPALRIDAARLYYDPNLQVLWACEAPIASVPGGQPGGFNDYSSLPAEKYIDVFSYQGRAFWIAPKGLYFSYKDNPFSYALRNTVPCPTGEFKGGLVYLAYGQSQQYAKVVVVGTREIYVGRFNGNQQTMPIQVSANVQADYPIDGSDFIFEPLTSNTAFSARAMVTADGVLYWWGPDGIFKYDGVGVPAKVSYGLEPNLSKLYVPNGTDEIFAIYSADTKEIIWVYPPRADSTKSYAVVFNTDNSEFDFWQFPGKIDSAQQINLEKSSVSRNTSGKRTLISSRADSSTTIQRGYFFDPRNRAGDIFPGTEFVLGAIANVTGGKRLTLSGGFSAPAFAAISVGDSIVLSQLKDYTGLNFANDMICKVFAKGTNYLDVVIPSTEALSTASLGIYTCAPIYHPPTNGISYIVDTNIWAPGGRKFWGFWEYLHFIFKVDLLPTWSLHSYGVAVSYKTPIGAAFNTQVATLRDNSDGNYQLYLPTKPDGQAAEGQGMRFQIQGLHCGGSWVLQYLRADVNPQPVDNLAHFEP